MVDTSGGILRNSERFMEEVMLDGHLVEYYVEFEKLKTDEARYVYIRSVLDTKDIPNQVYKDKRKLNKKSAELSQEARTKGNVFFKDGDYRTAISLYNESVANAHALKDERSNKNHLSLALSNRSAALFYIEEYKHCLRDIDHSIRAGYPEDLHYKLYDRKGKCLRALNSHGAAKLAFETANNSLAKAKLDNAKKEEMRQEFQKAIKQCKRAKKKKPDNVDILAEEPEEPLPELADGPHPIYPALSKACEVVYTPGLGRGVLATRDILPGEVVLAEKPYAAPLDSMMLRGFCTHCFKKLLAPMVCLTCPIARYCSTTCRYLSWNSYHQYECPHIDIEYQAGRGLHMAIRMVLVAGRDYLLSYRERNLNPDKSDELGLAGYSKDGLYLSNSYDAIFHLVRNNKDHPLNDLFHKAALAVLSVRCLEETRFFDGIPEEELEDAKNGIGALIMRHYQQIGCNAYTVDCMHPKGTPSEMGRGMWVTYALINHSCDIESHPIFYGNRLVLRTLRTVKKGEEINVNYGFIYHYHNKLTRKQHIQEQYFFDCQCRPCALNWGLYPQIPDAVPTYKCGTCQTKLPLHLGQSPKTCPKCDALLNLEEKKRSLREYSRLYRKHFKGPFNDNDLSDMPIFLKYIEIMDDLLVHPWKDYINCVGEAQACMFLQGNCHEKIRYKSYAD